VILTHDVEGESGIAFCERLLDIDLSFGFRSSFQVVPEGVRSVPAKLRETIRNRGCEVAIHDLNHDGRLFDSEEEFRRRAVKINQYGAEYGAKGFRSGVLYRNPKWYDALEFSYDMSIPNVAHLDPQHGGCCTVMPYFIGDLVELPLTTSQDYAMFHLLNENSIELWKEQVELVLAKHGLVSVLVHPDYVTRDDEQTIYEDLLRWLRQECDKRQLWTALPGEVATWWRERSRMSVVREGSSWRIEGEGAERAVLAFARNVNGKVEYQLADAGRSVPALP
jgi:hypothetical protein